EGKVVGRAALVRERYVCGNFRPREPPRVVREDLLDDILRREPFCRGVRARQNEQGGEKSEYPYRFHELAPLAGSRIEAPARVGRRSQELKARTRMGVTVMSET